MSENAAKNNSLIAKRIECPACSQTYLSLNQSQPIVCPNCARSTLKESGQPISVVPVEAVLPINVSRDSLKSIFENFVKAVWLPTAELNPETLITNLKITYWPVWMVDCMATGEWQAEMGFDYNVKSSKENFSGSTWQTQEVIEGRIRWEPRIGVLSRPYSNIPVPASTKHDLRKQKIGSYGYDKAVLPTQHHLQGSLMEPPDVSQQLSWTQAEPQVIKLAEAECQQACEAQHSRNFTLDANYDEQNWTQLLLPLLSTWYRDDNQQPHVVILNGQSGKISGARMASPAKGKRKAGIAALVSLILLIIAGITAIISQEVSQLGCIPGIFLLFGVLVGFGALIPLTWSQRWNRKQEQAG